MDVANVLLRYGSVPLRILDYRDGGFQLEGKRHNCTVNVAFTPYNHESFKVADQVSLVTLLAEDGSAWVTVHDPVQVYDDEMVVNDDIVEILERRRQMVLVG